MVGAPEVEAGKDVYFALLRRRCCISHKYITQLLAKNTDMERLCDCVCPQSLSWEFKALFTRRQGAPANRATRLGGLKHSPPLHASHLSEIVSRVAANHNKQDGVQKKRFFYHSFHKRPLFSIKGIILHSTN